MLADKQTYWISFDSSFTPKKPHSDIYKFKTMTAIVSNDTFLKVSDRKEWLLKGVKDKLIKWHIDRKYKKEKSEDTELIFFDGKTRAKFSHFAVKHSDLDIL